jgi:putative hydrolase of the HAD superfamily
MIKAIIFDAEDVIYYRDKETLKPIIDFFKQKGIKIDAEQFKTALDKFKLDAYKHKISKDEHLRKTLEIIKPGFDEKLYNEFVKVFRERYSEFKVNKNIMNIFKKIKSQNIKIAILTDTFATEEKKWEWFRSINLAEFIDVIACSSMTSYTKDEKEAYVAVLRKLNLKANEAMFVGHKEYEMKGAREAGIRSVSLEKGVGEDCYIKNISMILNLIS